MRIVVAEDNPDIRTLLADLLESEGHTVRVYAGGHAALKAIQQDVPDVACLDLAMPDGSGLDVAKAVRAAGLPLRLVCCSAHSAHLTPDERGLFDVIVPKPFDLDDVLAALGPAAVAV